MGAGFVLSASVEGGYTHSFENSRGAGIDPVRLTDRFFLGEPQMRGFDIRGVGPRVLRTFFNEDGTPNEDRSTFVDDALGGRAYYFGRAELQIPLPASLKEFGLRPSVFVDVGALFGLKDPVLNPPILPGAPETRNRCRNADGTFIDVPSTGCPSGTALIGGITPFREEYVGDTAKPRLSIGIGVNWNSPFGPLRLDIAKALLKERGDDTKFFTFNVGTAF